VIDYGMRAPLFFFFSLDPADYPLTARWRAASDIFPWARVKDTAICAPEFDRGTRWRRRNGKPIDATPIAGAATCLALGQAGRRRPAVTVDHIMISSSAADLAARSATAPPIFSTACRQSAMDHTGPICACLSIV